MKQPQALQYLLSKPMTRQEFLRHIGVGGLLLVGGGFIVNAFGGLDKLISQPTAKTSGAGSGYGMSVYGFTQQTRDSV